MEAVIILRDQAETCHGRILKAPTKVCIHDEAFDTKIDTLDPKLLRLANLLISDDATISDADGSVLTASDWTGAFFMFSNEEVLECLVLFNVRWLEIVHVNVVEVHKTFDLVM